VRVSPELVDARSGSTKWQESFESAVTDVFRVQGEIAANVAQALQLRLTPSAESALTRRPTTDLDAYDAFLRGLEIYDSGSDPTGEQARAALTLAVRLDSTFALAWAHLALAEGRRFLNSHNANAAEAMRKATERALALAPELPAAHARVGEYQSWVRHDNRAALAAYRKGLTFSPNSALLLARVGWAEMRLGRWDSALVHLVQASKLDPREAGRFADLTAAYLYLRRYDEAQSAMDRHAALAPASSPSINRRLWLALGKGDLNAARAVLRNIPPELDPLTVLAEYPTWQKAWVLDSSALSTLVLRGEVARESRPAKALVLAEAHSRLGDSVRATAWGERAARAYEKMLAESSDDPELLSGYGLALAYAGEREEAIGAGLRAKTLVPISSDAIAGQAYQAALVRIYLLLGENDLALDELEPLLQVPGSLSRDWLRIDLTFASLRGDPRFERLVGGT
jgi:tetratricopeptide (TPR) repeat protein